MYCSIDEAWNNKNSVANLSKRYHEHFTVNDDNELNSYKIDNNELNELKEENPIFVPRKDARFNKAPDTIYDNNILQESEDIKTEDIMLTSEEPKEEKTFKLPIKSVLKNEENKEKDCKELIEKVLSCPTCRKMIENKLNNKNHFNNFFNGEIREVLILILIGLIIMILIDLFIRISK
tara:strand:- start:9 stop:542 length:534 start_codon:yes stop_codon:yes gene_type:complete